MYTSTEVEGALKRITARFKRQDAALLIGRAHERMVTHRVAVLLEKEFRGWNVDCEYNRQGFGLDPKCDSAGKRRFPDIIAHKRGCIDCAANLLVIEAKPAWPTAGRKESDRNKLRRVSKKFGYQYAYFMTYNSGEDGTLHFARVQ